MKSKIHILLPVHNRLEITKQFVACLQNQSYKNYHLILIDDGSIDGTSEYVRKKISNLTVLIGKGNWWWGGSLHKGYLWLKKNPPLEKDIVLIMNDDTIFDKDFLNNILKFVKPNTLSLPIEKSFQTGKVLTGTNSSVSFGEKKKDASDTINNLSTRGLFMYYDVFEELKGFYPKLLPHYLSDIEFTYRANKKGFTLCLEQEFHLLVNEDETGYYKIDAANRIGFLKQYLSKKNMMNPLAWTSFTLLQAPWNRKLPQIYKIWKIAIWKIINYKKARNQL